MLFRAFISCDKIQMCKKAVIQNFNNHNKSFTPSNFHGHISQVQSPQPSYFRSTEPAQQDRKISEKTKTKRERWTTRQEVLVSLCVENFDVLESYRCNQIWPKLINKVCSLGPAKRHK